MGGKEPTEKLTAELLTAERAEPSRSDWAKAAAMTSEEIEATAAADPDEADMIMDWGNASIEMPRPKAVLNMRIDQDVLDYFRETGRGYQSLINAVLKSYVSSRRSDRSMGEP
jgi:uncharacterized protein (DUF4415 family)